jgi:hypothetical protein
MDKRRAFLGTILGTAALAMTQRTGLAQPTAGQQQGQASGESLPNRGRPTGRIGAATRSARTATGDLALDLVAPLRGVGLTSVDQPTLCYVLSGNRTQPVRLAISMPSQARPIANLEVPHVQRSGLGVVRLRDHGIRLPPEVLCVWSVTLALDPHAPSRDLVASALVQYRPGDPGSATANRQAPTDTRIAALLRAGYWYDAVALAEQIQHQDRGVALASLFEQAELRGATNGRSDPGPVR